VPRAPDGRADDRTLPSGVARVSRPGKRVDTRDAGRDGASGTLPPRPRGRPTRGRPAAPKLRNRIPIEHHVARSGFPAPRRRLPSAGRGRPRPAAPRPPVRSGILLLVSRDTSRIRGGVFNPRAVLCRSFERGGPPLPAAALPIPQTSSVMGPSRGRFDTGARRARPRPGRAPARAPAGLRSSRPVRQGRHRRTSWPPAPRKRPGAPRPAPPGTGQSRAVWPGRTTRRSRAPGATSRKSDRSIE